MEWTDSDRAGLTSWGFSRRLCGQSWKAETTWYQKTLEREEPDQISKTLVVERAFLFLSKGGREQGWHDQVYISKYQRLRGKKTVDKAGGGLQHRTDERCPGSSLLTGSWKYFCELPRGSGMPPVIASRADLWENLSLITNSITRLGFKLILVLCTRQICQ